MAIRKDFNWSLLTREALFSMLNNIQSKIVGKRLSVEKLHQLMSKHIKAHLPIKVKFDRDPKNDKGFVYVGGTYYSQLDQNNLNRYIEIIFSYNPDQQYFTLSRHRWTRLCILFADTMLHEIVHCRQYRSRKFKAIPGYESTAHYARARKEEEYYGDTDEIGAFAFNIACELYDKFGNNYGEAATYLDTNQYRRHKRTSFYKYMVTFGHNHNHPIIKRIKRKALNQFPNVEIGKPFRTSNYLTY
jgi:hypothetical protein